MTLTGFILAQAAALHALQATVHGRRGYGQSPLRVLHYKEKPSVSSVVNKKKPVLLVPYSFFSLSLCLSTLRTNSKH